MSLKAFMRRIKMEIAIFTPAIAEALIARGFELVARTDKAFFFIDSIWLQIALEELIEEFNV